MRQGRTGERGRETKSRRGGAEGRGGPYPDIHRTLFFILHYPCSTPLYSIMPAPRINDESVPFTALRPSPAGPPDANHHMSIRSCPSFSTSLCATAINTGPCASTRLSNEKSMYLLYAAPLHNPHQTSPKCIL